MSSYLQNFMESMTESCEQMIKVVEEGVSVLMGLSQGNDKSHPSRSSNSDSINYLLTDDDIMIGEDEDIAGMKSPLDGITEEVLADIMKNQAKPATMKESFDAFRSAITWGEPFILGIVTFQVVMILTTLFVTKRCGLVPRMALLTLLAGIVRSAEWLNHYGAKNWESFATQNYFDQQGIFISIMMSGPLLFMAFFMLISYLREASRLLVKVKKHELKQKRMKATKKGSKKQD